MAEVNKPFVSIIVNCFNGEKYLNQALQSAINQTFKNWELIFWDNQSTDNSKKTFLQIKEERFKYFCSDHHTTLYEARNKAIEKSKGEFIAFLDVDDWWEKSKLEKQIVFFEDPKVGLVYSNLYLFNENKKKRKIYSKKILKSGYLTKDLLKNYNIGITTLILRKSAYKAEKGFDNQYNVIGDFDLVLRLSCNWKFQSVQEPLSYYRIHNDNFILKNNFLEIEEFQKWISDQKIFSNKNFTSSLKFVNQRIIFLKTIKYIKDGKFFDALKNIFFFPISLKKIKLIIYLILPKKILYKIKNFH